jgi:small conductance mechanosensitive channel
MDLSQEQIDALLAYAKAMGLEYGMRVLSAVAILILGWLASSWAQKGVFKLLGRIRNFDNTLKPVLANLVRYGILAVVFTSVLATFGVQTASIIAMLGAAGLAIGLALQGTLSNIAAGVMLLVLRPFQIDDYIDAEGVAGTVVEPGLFTCTMKTIDGLYVSVPNSKLWGSKIVNYSRNPTRRVEIDLGIGYGSDIKAARQGVMEIVAAEPRILADPAPLVLVELLGDSAVLLKIRVWTPRLDWADLRSDLTQAVKEKMDEIGIEIPFPQRVVQMKGAA